MTRLLQGLLAISFLGGCAAPPFQTYDELGIQRRLPAIHYTLTAYTHWRSPYVGDWRRTGLSWGEIALIHDMGVLAIDAPDDIWETMRRRRASFRCMIEHLGIERDLAKQYGLETLPCDSRMLPCLALEVAIATVEGSTRDEVEAWFQLGATPEELCEAYLLAGKAAPREALQAALARVRHGELGQPHLEEPKSEQPKYGDSQPPRQDQPLAEPPK